MSVDEIFGPVGYWQAVVSGIERERDEALARADRLADRAVMLESLVARQEAQLAEIARLLKPCVCFRKGEFDGVNVNECMKNLLPALVVAEGES